MPTALAALFAILPLTLPPLDSSAGQAAKPTPPPPPAVRVGDPAPDFTLRFLAPGPEGKPQQTTVSLSSFKGRQSVILAFFPAAFSGGWTTQMSRFRDQADKVAAAKAQVLGVSVDSVFANRAFADSLKLDFPLLSDARREVSKLYGVLDENSGMARRVTFVIDESGIVRHIDQSADAMDPTRAIAACPVPSRKAP